MGPQDLKFRPVWPEVWSHPNYIRKVDFVLLLISVHWKYSRIAKNAYVSQMIGTANLPLHEARSRLRALWR